MNNPQPFLHRLLRIPVHANLRAYISQSNKEGLRNPWFLGLLVLMGVFIVVNFVFIVFAVASNPGLVDNNYYENGRDYEKHLVSRRQQRQLLNWQTRLELPRSAIAGKPGVIRFSAVDALGLPIEQAQVVISAYRPSNASDDFRQTLNAIGPGIDQGKISFPLPGVWDVRLFVNYNDNHFAKQDRIHVKAVAN